MTIVCYINIFLPLVKIENTHSFFILCNWKYFILSKYKSFSFKYIQFFFFGKVDEFFFHFFTNWIFKQIQTSRYDKKCFGKKKNFFENIKNWFLEEHTANLLSKYKNNFFWKEFLKSIRKNIKYFESILLLSKPTYSACVLRRLQQQLFILKCFDCSNSLRKWYSFPLDAPSLYS